MAAEPKPGLELELGHVLFIDMVGYSKLLLDEQKERLRQLTEIVLATGAMRWHVNFLKLIRQRLKKRQAIGGVIHYCLKPRIAV